MSEFIVIQVGQCGNQIGSCLWPTILQEYNINLRTEKDGKINNKHVHESFNSFFHVPKPQPIKTLKDILKNKVKARAICIDMEDSVVSRFKTGQLKSIFDKKCLITNYPGSGNNWAEGYYEHGPNFAEQILNVIQYTADKCDALHGFLLMFSTGGGTGSGLGTYVLKLLADYFPNIERLVICVYPIGTEDVITCPYNMTLATNEILNYATCVIPIENRALLDILRRENLIPAYRTFEDINGLIVNMLMDLTSGSRFSGKFNFDMNELNTNMVPYPKLKYLVTGSSSTNKSLTLSREMTQKRKISTFLAACSRNNQLVKVDPTGPKSILLSSTLIGRGDYDISDMKDYVTKLQTKAKFTSWSKHSMKIGICSVPPYKSENSMLAIFNTTSICHLFENILGQFVKLYTRKAHVHHYLRISRFDSDSFEECQNSIQEIIQMYEELHKVKPITIPRLKCSH